MASSDIELDAEGATEGDKQLRNHLHNFAGLSSLMMFSICEVRTVISVIMSKSPPMENLEKESPCKHLHIIS